MLYQTLIGTWPSTGIDAGYIDRIQAYLLKVVREAGRFSNWVNPNQEYETALQDFIAGVLNKRRARAFQKDLDEFVAAQRDASLVNALAQQVMKLASPGVPDIYQGTELWDDSLVDPDNRRPVDFEKRQKMLGANQSMDRLVAERSDGGIKLEITAKLLQYRRDYTALFAEGDYTQVRASGAASEHVIAYTRECEDRTMIVVLPRIVYLLSEGGDVFGNTDIWAETSLQFPASMPVDGWRNLLSGERVENPSDLADLFVHMPLAVLVRQGESDK